MIETYLTISLAAAGFIVVLFAILMYKFIYKDNDRWFK